MEPGHLRSLESVYPYVINGSQVIISGGQDSELLKELKTISAQILSFGLAESQVTRLDTSKRLSHYI